jgi:hypothetical protein
VKKIVGALSEFLSIRKNVGELAPEILGILTNSSGLPFVIYENSQEFLAGGLLNYLEFLRILAGRHIFFISSE